jgi:SsrA-binding protein
MTVIRKNKHAFFKYSVEKEYEAGAALTGLQVKYIKSNDFEIQEAFIRAEHGELFMWNIVFPFSQNALENKVKLLLNRNEIDKILNILKDRKKHGFLVAVRYNDKNRVKFDIGFGTIKKAREKKSSEKRTSEKRQLEKDIKTDIYG